ncbi:hypothetical protein BJY52DRAFT_1154569 [Lactarius psammicola]|nr:hypothetical protein BJY52DRAFT_1154569 [Lactarius psammicola]
MASTSTKQSSRFSTLKVFKFTSSKPPPPPPKDAHYLYASSSKNPSVVSFSNQSVLSPDSDSPSACKSIRSPSPAPSRMLQSHFQPEQHQSQQSPPPSIMSSSRTLDPSSASSKKSFFRKVSSLRKRSASKNSRVTSVDDATDDESISLPYNVQHHIHIDEAFQGVPPEWSSTLAELGYSEAEVALIQKGRRNRSPMQEPPPSTAPSRSQSPASTTIVNPRARSSSLRRQKSDASISRSERSLRVGPPAPPPPLPLPPPPQTPSAGPSSAIPAAPPPTPASGGAFGEIADKDDDTTRSDTQYAYLNPHQPTPIQPVPAPAPAPAPVPVAQPTPVHVLQRSPSSPSTRPPPLRTDSADRERRVRAQTPPRRQFRVVNTTPPRREGSPQSVYLEDAARSVSPLPITPIIATQGDTAPLRRPSVSETPPLDPLRAEEGPRPAPAMQSSKGAERGTKEEDEDEEDEGGDEIDDSGLNGFSSRRQRPSVLSILPPRLSLRKDTLGDLSSWSASLFSSIPSSSHDGSGSSASTAGTSSASTRTSPADTNKPNKPSVTLPSIVLHPEIREPDGEEGEQDDEGHGHENENEYSFSASPLYHELMGMMQERSATANGISSPASGSPASANFQHDPVSPDVLSTRRDSQLTIRLDPRRDSTRDSSASSSTIVHATIVRGASIVRRVRADVITTPSVVCNA